MASRSFWAWLYWWPVRQTDQTLFAEAFSQALDAGLEISLAVRVAAAAEPRPRFRAALHEMAANCRLGYTLADSLVRTGVTVSDEFVAALAIGEERGDLPDSLAAFARQNEGRPGARLAAAVGRRPETTRFAAALARLLRDRGLTVGLITDAARLAAGNGSSFAEAIKRVSEHMCGGATFAYALSREPGFFDPLFCALVNGPDSRDRLRAVLARMGDVTDAEPVSRPLNPKETKNFVCRF